MCEVRNESADGHEMAGTFVYRNSTLYTELASLRVSKVCDSEEQRTCRATDVLRRLERQSESQMSKSPNIQCGYASENFRSSNSPFSTCLCTDNTVPEVTIPPVFPPGDPRLNLLICKSYLVPGLRHIQQTRVNLEFRGVMTSLESNLTTCYLSEYT